MDEDEDFDIDSDDLTVVVVLPPRPVTRLDLLAFTFWATARAAATVVNVADEFADLMAMHIGHRLQRTAMAEAAALEIETLTGGAE